MRKLIIDAIFEFEGGVGGVVSGAFVRLSLLIDAFGDVGGSETGDGLYFAEEVVEDVAPMAEHVDDDAAVVFLAIVPGRALGWDGVAFEYPVSELASDGEEVAKEAVFKESLYFEHAGQPEFVLDDTVFSAGVFA